MSAEAVPGVASLVTVLNEVDGSSGFVTGSDM
jgi:hypothetical protein